MDAPGRQNRSGTDRYRPLTAPRSSPFRKGVPGNLLLMARQSQLDSARLRRDLGLARARRLTVYSAVGATAFTAVFALVAATSLPGHTVNTTPASQPGVTDNGSFAPGISTPIQAPQYGYGVPVAVSGGS